MDSELIILRACHVVGLGVGAVEVGEQCVCMWDLLENEMLHLEGIT